MRRITLKIEAVVRSPFLFSGLTGQSFGLDAAALRDNKERPLLPADQLRGVLRHALEEIRAATKDHMVSGEDIRALFGAPSKDVRETSADEGAEANAPARGRLLFGDLTAEGLESMRHKAMRVAIDPETGAAKEGALVLVELVAPPGKPVSFSGEAILFAQESEERRWIERLQAAASWISSIGAMKSAGYGEVVSLSIEKAASVALTAPAAPQAPAHGRLRLHIRIDRPFVVNAVRLTDNVFSGDRIIPGGALKGALAHKMELMGLAPEQNKDLSNLLITHAAPEGEPPPLPLSLVAVAGEGSAPVFGDALRVAPGRGAMIQGKPALFQSDWKGWEDKARETLGQSPEPVLRRDPRMHAAINRASGAAEDEKLFLLEAVDPGETLWVFDVDFREVATEQRGLFAALLAEGARIDGLGRTGAALTVARVASANISQPAPVEWAQDEWAVLLETDAVMASPKEGEAWAAYEAYWGDVLPQARLVNFYARQELAGGYQALRHRTAPGAYRPFWLTKAGSVFLLKGNLREDLVNLLRRGLPAPVVDKVPTDWRSCPFQPENGYGRIRVDYRAALAGGTQDV